MSTNEKPKSFIIQPFDEGEFDELYDDVIEIAVEQSGAVCLRSDKILGAKPPLAKIQSSIEDASVCIAEVTLDNPNVFFEAGWAFALGKPTFVLWDKSKRPAGLPFDIHNKAGIPYDSSKQGWRKELREKLIDNIKFELTNFKNQKIHIVKKEIPSNPINVEGQLSEIEITVLGVLLKAKAKHQEIGVLPMTSLLVTLGYADVKIAITLAKMVRTHIINRTYNTNGDAVCYYYLASTGDELIEANYSKIEPMLEKLPDDYSMFAASRSGWL